MSWLRNSVRYAYRLILLFYGAVVMIFTGAAGAMIAQHFGAGEFKQGAIFALVCIYLFRAIGWLVDKADL